MTLVKVSILGNKPAELHALFAWLQRNDEFRGQIKTQSRPLRPDEMGAAVEILTIALGSGGAGAALASSLATWLQTRRARIVVELVVNESGETVRKVEVDARNAAEVEELYGLLAPDQKLP